MNLAIRSIEGQIAHGDSFHNDRHPDLKADFILANPPFNVSDWSGERLADDKRWRYGVPPKGNANFAWVQHMVHHLAPAGIAGFVLANGSMSSSQSGEGEIRKNLIEADLVDCMVALPGQLFYSTQIPACLWFLARRRPRRGESSVHRRPQAGPDGGPHAPRVNRRRHCPYRGRLPRLARRRGSLRRPSGLLQERRARRGAAARPCADSRALCWRGAASPTTANRSRRRCSRLVAELQAQQAEGARLDAAIAENLKSLGFGGKGS